MGQRQIISSVACGLGFAVLLLSTRHAKGLDSSPHSVTFVAADKNVSLEVLDWGGARQVHEPWYFCRALGTRRMSSTNLRPG